jgi:hypothetical protein
VRDGARISDSFAPVGGHDLIGHHRRQERSAKWTRGTAGVPLSGVRVWHRRQRRLAERLPDVPRHRLDTDRSVSTDGALVTGSDPPGGGEANGGKPPQQDLSTARNAQRSLT